MRQGEVGSVTRPMLHGICIVSRFVLPCFATGCHTFNFKIATAALRPRNDTKMVGFFIEPTIFATRTFESVPKGHRNVPTGHSFTQAQACTSLAQASFTWTSPALHFDSVPEGHHHCAPLGRYIIRPRGRISYAQAYIMQPTAVYHCVFPFRLSCKKTSRADGDPFAQLVLDMRRGLFCGIAPSDGCAGCSLFVKITAGWRSA